MLEVGSELRRSGGEDERDRTDEKELGKQLRQPGRRLRTRRRPVFVNTQCTTLPAVATCAVMMVFERLTTLSAVMPSASVMRVTAVTRVQAVTRLKAVSSLTHVMKFRSGILPEVWSCGDRESCASLSRDWFPQNRFLHRSCKRSDETNNCQNFSSSSNKGFISVPSSPSASSFSSSTSSSDDRNSQGPVTVTPQSSTSTSTVNGSLQDNLLQQSQQLHSHSQKYTPANTVSSPHSFTTNPTVGTSNWLKGFIQRNPRLRRPLQHQQSQLPLTPQRFQPSSTLQQSPNQHDILLQQQQYTNGQHPTSPEAQRHPRKKVIVSVLAFSTVFAAVLGLFMASYNDSGAWRYYIAGGTCAAVSHVVPVPIDVVKTRKQIDPNLADSNVWEIGRDIVKNEGPAALLCGFGPTAFGYLLEGAVKFGVYEVMKPIIHHLLHTSSMAVTTLLSIPTAQIISGSPLSPLALLHSLRAILIMLVSNRVLSSDLMCYATCAAVSGVAASLVLCPMEALRIRIVAHPEQFTEPSTSSTNSTHSTRSTRSTVTKTNTLVRIKAQLVQLLKRNFGWMHVGYKIVQTEGVGALTRGIDAMLLKQVPYTITKNVSFDVVTKWMYGILIQHCQWTAIPSSAKLIVPLFAAFIASGLSCVASQPGDMLLSLVNAHPPPTFSSSSSSSSLALPIHTAQQTQQQQQQPTLTTTSSTFQSAKGTHHLIQDILRSRRGVRGFFVGMRTRFVHVGIIVTVQLLIYDYVKRLCGIAATGTT